MTMCVICQERPSASVNHMCKQCGKSYDRCAFSDVTVWCAMTWAAKRARRFERARRKAKR